MDRTAARVKKTLMKEQGVANVTVSYEKKELIVSFDDAKTTPDVLLSELSGALFQNYLA